MLKRCVFNRLSIGMIPKSYRESLTYEEQILWLQKYVNDMLEWLTKLQEDFDNIDLNFDEIEAKINEINTDEIVQKMINAKYVLKTGCLTINLIITAIRQANENQQCFNKYKNRYLLWSEPHLVHKK